MTEHFEPLCSKTGRGMAQKSIALVMTALLDPGIAAPLRSRHERSARRQRLVAHLHAAGPRPCLEALIEVANGRDLDDVLERFALVPINTYRALGADILPIHRLTLVDGDAA